MKTIIRNLKKFEAWFDKKFGWFFVNGHKAIQKHVNKTTA